MLLYLVGFLAVIGMAGFALDLGLAMLTMTRLQNALDAAALDGAKALATSGDWDTAEGEAAAKATFAANIDGSVPTVTFSPTQSPFVAGGANPRYVMVSVTGWAVQTYLSRVLGFADSYNIAGSAMAGPLYLSEPCGSPLGICGNPASADTDCSDGNGCFGVTTDEITLKDEPIGPGNYGLLDMGSGGAAVADGMAGSANLCLSEDDVVSSEPGLKQNVIQAVNTRFGTTLTGQYSDQETYPPDKVSVGGIEYDDYESRLANGPHDHPGGVARRRELVMPIIDCSAAAGGGGGGGGGGKGGKGGGAGGGGGGVAGKTDVTVLGHACMFLTRPALLLGGIYAQMIEECMATGGSPTTDSSSGAYRIVLFQSGVKS